MFRKSVVALAALTLGVLGIAGAVFAQESDDGVFDPLVKDATPVVGIETFEVEPGIHVTEPVDYAQDPPAGGPHHPAWQRCAVYDAPIIAEHAVHSLEHGAVWITYRPDLPEAERAVLKEFATDNPFILVSPYPGLEEPAVASAWGAQLRLADVNDPRLQEFIDRFSGNGPERGGRCDTGIETTLPE